MDGKKKTKKFKQGKHTEAGRNSQESEKQTSHLEVLRKSQEIEVETQTSHPEVKRAAHEAQHIPKAIANEEPAPILEEVETQTSHTAVRRVSREPQDTLKQSGYQQPTPKSEEIETQTSYPAVKKIKGSPKSPRTSLQQDSKKPVRSSEEPGQSNPKPRDKPKAKKPKNLSIEVPLPSRKSQEAKPARKSQELGKPVRKPQELGKPVRKSLETGRPVRKSLETGRPARKSLETGRPARKSLETGRPARKSLETGRPARKSQELQSQALKPQQTTRASLEVKKQKSPPAVKKQRGSSSRDLQKVPAANSTTRVPHNPEFPDLEEEQPHLVPRKPSAKPSKNIFQKIAQTVSSIFMGPKSSDEDSEDAARRNVRPIPLKDAGPDMSRFFGPPVPILDPKARKTLEVKSMDEGINRELSLIMEHYKETSGKDKKSKMDRNPKYSYGEIMTTLRQQGIPLPSDEDFARLENSHGQRWDPDGTVLEYYSPVLRSFIPLNMRGRYRGCWTQDQCIQGLDISKLAPKPDALEGYVDRGRQYRIQAIYDALEPVALSEDHLDYLVEVYKTQVLLLPIPIFYDVLNLGCETLNWNIKILQSKEGIPPQNKIYSTTEDRAVCMQKKLQVYAALGLEPLFSPRKGMGRIQPQWTKTRDELITSLIARQHELEHERKLVQQADRAPKKVANSKESFMQKQEFTDRVSLASMVQGDVRNHK